MHCFHCKIGVTVIFVTFFVCANVDASFWDGIVGVSQLKTATQFALGDKKGASQTNRNFWRQMPGISQINSGLQLARGRTKDAKNTQIQFIRETVEPFINNIPVIGHGKGAIHLLFGDRQKGLDIIKGATTSTAMVV